MGLTPWGMRVCIHAMDGPTSQTLVQVAPWDQLLCSCLLPAWHMHADLCTHAVQRARVHGPEQLHGGPCTGGPMYMYPSICVI